MNFDGFWNMWHSSKTGASPGCRIIADAAGTQFDPVLVTMFTGVREQFRQICERLRSEDVCHYDRPET